MVSTIFMVAIKNIYQELLHSAGLFIQHIKESRIKSDPYYFSTLSKTSARD